MSRLSKPTFVTANLRVWEIRGVPSEINGSHSRVMFIATLRNEDWPGVAVSLSIWPAFDNYVDWIETAEPQRRKGFAAELVDAVEKRYGPVTFHGVSEGGIAMEDSRNRKETP